MLHKSGGRKLGLRSISLSADGNYLLTTSKRSIKNWKLGDDGLPDGEPVSQLDTKYGLYGAYFAPEGKTVLTVGRGSNVNRYALEDNKLDDKVVKSLSGHSQTVLDVHFIPGADAAITLGTEAELYAWDLSNNQALFSLRLPTHSGTPLTLSNFASSCNERGCQFAVPLPGKRNEAGKVVIYDFMFRPSVN